MSQYEQFVAALAAINEATNALAVEVARLREVVASGGMSAAQEADVLTSLADIEVKLKAIAAEPPPAA